MSAAAQLALLLSRDACHCPHHPPCPNRGRDAAVVDAHPERGWSLLCNGGMLFHDGTYIPRRPRDEIQRVRVVLRVWARARSAIAPAVIEAYDTHLLWDIVDVIPSVSERCPLERHAPFTLAFRADDGRVWAAYPAMVAPV